MLFKSKIFVLLVFTILVFGLIVLSCNEKDVDEDDNKDEIDDDDATDDDMADDDAADDDSTDDDSVDDDDSADDDDDDDNDDNSEVTIESTENGECKNMDDSKDKFYWPQDILFVFQNGNLLITHVNGEFNCCIDYISTSIQLNGNVIDLYEVEVASQPCFCICPFDVTTTVSGLASGTYTVNIYANGVFAVSGQTTVP